MKHIYTDTKPLDCAALERFCLTEDILMENAAAALEKEVLSAAEQTVFDKEFRILIVTGSGDNGGDGWALARRLSGSRVSGKPCDVTVLKVYAPKSGACKKQALRAQSVSVRIVSEMPDTSTEHFHIIVDCLFGSGFHGSLPAEAAAVIKAVNEHKAFRIACDIPSGIDSCGCGETAFCADVTVCMGALKTALFGDFAKDYTGKIVTASLGLSAARFESAAGFDCPSTSESNASGVPAAFLLEAEDFKLPVRTKKAVHKGEFGHAAVFAGEKSGASLICAAAALRYGAGLVTLVHKAGSPLGFTLSDFPQDCSRIEEPRAPCTLMQSDTPPVRVSAFACGMGFGRSENERAHTVFELLTAYSDVPCVLDADMCYYPFMRTLLECRPQGLVLTPHPKEFQALLGLCGMARLSVEKIVRERLQLAAEFCQKFPGLVLLLKGANTIIGSCPAGENRLVQSGAGQLYINTFGTPALAKAGSGDVLAGLICALLAQKHPPLDAAVQASLALAASSRLQKADYASTPLSLTAALENPEALKNALKSDRV